MAVTAILRAQFLSMRSFRLGSSRRGAVFSLLTAVIWYGFWAMLAFLAQQFTSGGGREEIVAALPRGLMVVFLYWQLAPLASASLGASLDLRKLLVYPIPVRSLFLVEVLLRLTTCLEMILVLVGGVIGLLRNPEFGGAASAPRLLIAALAFVIFNLLLAAGLRSLLERLLARKRIREILVLLLVMTTALPRVLVAAGVPFQTLEDLFSGGQQRLWPWAACGSAMLGRNVLAGSATLALWGLLAGWFGRWQFLRSLRYDIQAAQATEVAVSGARNGSWSERLYRLPAMLLPDPLGAVVEKELRTLSRTPRFRLVFIMGFSFGLLVWLPLVIGRRSGGHSAVGDNFLILVSVYALTLLGQVSYWNAFGFDRSAAQVYFALPVPLSKTLQGKNLAAGIFILLEMAAVTSASLLLRVRVPPAKILEAFLVTPVAALYMLALGNLSSVHYPRAMNPERVARGGAGSRFQALLFIFYPAALSPIFLAYLARYAFHSQVIFWVVLAFAAALGAGVYSMAMESAVAAARRRREIILQELCRGEGPVVTE